MPIALQFSVSVIIFTYHRVPTPDRKSNDPLPRRPGPGPSREKESQIPMHVYVFVDAPLQNLFCSSFEFLSSFKELTDSTTAFASKGCG